MPHILSRLLIFKALSAKSLAAFSLIEVCVAAIILAIIGSQMYQLSSLTRENFRLTKDYLEADQKLYSEIAFARNAALRYTWCDVLNGVDQDATTKERKVIINNNYSKVADFCADEFYAKAPVSVYKPPYILTQTDPSIDSASRNCYGFEQGNTVLLPIGTLKIIAGSQDSCERFPAYNDTAKYQEYKPWDLFLAKCRVDMRNNTYEPTQLVTEFPEFKADGTRQADRVPAESDPIVGNLVAQLRAHAEKNNVMTKYYNKSSIDQKLIHRIVLFYTVSLEVKGTTRTVTRVLYLTAPVAAWCPY